MDWSDDGIVLAARRHGESSAVVQLLTRGQGRHAGLARGGAGSRGRGIYQPGNLVAARWRARLPEHLGSYTCELAHSYAAALLDDPLRLAALASACAVAEAALPERHPYPKLYGAFIALLDGLDGEPQWAAVYARWELGLLDELGFGLDLSRCASTGVTENLSYVSPKSGRAVSREAGAPYRDKLLPLAWLSRRQCRRRRHRSARTSPPRCASPAISWGATSSPPTTRGCPRRGTGLLIVSLAHLLYLVV